MNWSADIMRVWRTETQRSGKGESELVIPLQDSRGFAYLFDSNWFGVWYNVKTPESFLERIKKKFPDVVVQQIGLDECTFRVPMEDLPKVLKFLKARKKRKLTEAQKAANAERLAPHAFKKQGTPATVADLGMDE